MSDPFDRPINTNPQPADLIFSKSSVRGEHEPIEFQVLIDAAKQNVPAVSDVSNGLMTPELKAKTEAAYEAVTAGSERFREHVGIGIEKVEQSTYRWFTNLRGNAKFISLVAVCSGPLTGSHSFKVTVQKNGISLPNLQNIEVTVSSLGTGSATLPNGTVSSIESATIQPFSRLTLVVTDLVGTPIDFNLTALIEYVPE